MIDERHIREMLIRRAGAISAIPANGAKAVQKARRRVAATSLLSAALLIALSAVAIGSVRGMTDPSQVYKPSPAPSRSAVAPGEDQLAIYVDVETGRTSSIPDSIATLFPLDFDVSPDGQRLAFQSEIDGDIYLAARDGSGVVKLTDLPTASRANDLDWSQQGNDIVFTSNGRILVVDVSTGDVTALTDDVRPVLEPVFSPDGRTVVFTTWREGTSSSWYSLWQVSLEGGAPSLFMKGAAFGSFSPDGSTIAFLHVAGASDPLWGDEWDVDDCVRLSNADGNNRRVLGDDEDCRGSGSFFAWSYERPEWSPNGDEIAYAYGGREPFESTMNLQVRIIDAATGEASTLIEGWLHATWVDEDTILVEDPNSHVDLENV